MPSLFRLRSVSRGTWVTQSDAGKLTHSASAEYMTHRTVMLWQANHDDGVGVLIANPPGVCMFNLTGLRARQRLLGVFVTRAANGVNVSLTPGRFMSAVPSANDMESGTIEFDRTLPMDWELFELDATHDILVPADLERVFCRLHAFLAGPIHASELPTPPAPLSSRRPRGDTERSWSSLFTPIRFGDALQHPAPGANASDLLESDWPLIYQAIYGMLPESQRTEVALRLLAEAPQWSNVVTSELQDPWLTIAIPDLSRWLKYSARRPLAPKLIGRDLDFISQAGLTGTPASLGHIAAATIRKMVAPRKKSCVLATARNEGLYLLEWIGHHKALGFDHIFIYTNHNTDQSDALLGALAAAGEITWIQNDLAPGTTAQMKAYSHALSLLPDILDYEWTAIIDLDEFICLDHDHFEKISDYLKWQQQKPTHAIALNWLMYGSNGQTTWRNEPLAQRFPESFDHTSATVKSIVRTNLFFQSQPHFPITDINTSISYRDAEGRPHHYDPNSETTAVTPHPSRSLAWIAHHAFKSLDEFLWKSTRNRGDVAVTQDRTFAVRADIARIFLDEYRPTPSSQRPAVAPLVERSNFEIARLTTIPGVKAAFDTITRHYQTEIPEIRERFKSALSAADDPTLQVLGALITLV